MTITAKELLVCVQRDRRAVMVLVPKRRGEGFVKVPLGHHYDAVAKLCHEIDRGDVYGLDGHLQFETGPLGWTDEAAQPTIRHIADALGAHYGMTWRQVDEAEFWANHPIKV